MPDRRTRLLILGGTTEAGVLAAEAVARFHGWLTVVTSLAGRLDTRPALAGDVRVGGFGGAAGLANYLRQDRVDLVVDATHPFATQISRQAATACAATGVPRLMLVRPPWVPAPGDRWLEVMDVAEAAAAIATVARRAFLTTGPQTLAAFAGAKSVWFLVRLFAAAAEPPPLARATVVVARPPFTVAGDMALMAQHGVEALVTKNSGGPTEAKLIAARTLGLPVVVIRRPPLIGGDRVDTVAAALDWVAARPG